MCWLKMRTPDAKWPWSPLAAGWLVHATSMLLLGWFQQDYRNVFDTLFNTPLMWLLHHLGSPHMDHWMLTMSWLGGGNALAAAFVPIMLLVWLRGSVRSLLAATAVMFGTALMAGIAKLVIHSARPQLWQSLEQAGGSSFPSSHAGGGMGFALALWILLPKRWRPALGAPLLGFGILVGLSRVYLGVHTPTDVLLTWLLVLSWSVWVVRCFNVEKRAPLPNLATV